MHIVIWSAVTGVTLLFSQQGVQYMNMYCTRKSVCALFLVLCLTQLAIYTVYFTRTRSWPRSLRFGMNASLGFETSITGGGFQFAATEPINMTAVDDYHVELLRCAQLVGRGNNSTDLSLWRQQVKDAISLPKVTQ